jgi:hypothetical protein
VISAYGGSKDASFNSVSNPKDTAYFITSNQLTITSSSVTAKYLITVSVQFFTSKTNIDYGITLTRGTSSTPSTSYINLATNLALSGSEMQLATGVNSEDKLLTTFQQNTVYNSGSGSGSSFTFLDTPGIGTFYYNIRFLTNSDQQIHHRNTLLYYIQVSL